MQFFFIRAILKILFIHSFERERDPACQFISKCPQSGGWARTQAGSEELNSYPLHENQESSYWSHHHRFLGSTLGVLGQEPKLGIQSRLSDMGYLHLNHYPTYPPLLEPFNNFQDSLKQRMYKLEGEMTVLVYGKFLFINS